VIEGVKVVARLQVRVQQQFLAVEHGRCLHPRLLQQMEGLDGVLSSCPLFYEDVQGIVVLLGQRPLQRSSSRHSMPQCLT
jgi:hypothetical protein